MSAGSRPLIGWYQVTGGHPGVGPILRRYEVNSTNRM